MLWSVLWRQLEKLADQKDHAAVREASQEEKELIKESESFVTKFEDAMDDDFNTADALAAVFELVKFSNTNVTGESSAEFAGQLFTTTKDLCEVLGLNVEKKDEILDKEIENLIEERQEARKSKNFARADEIRDELLAKGIQLNRYTRRCNTEKNLDNLKQQFQLEDRDLIRPGFSLNTGVYWRWCL